MTSSLTWLFKPFNELDLDQLYEVIALRESIFVVEQACAYQEADGVDKQSIHVLGYQQNALVAYCRIVLPGAKYKEISIGRVLTHDSVRSQGAGKQLMQTAIDYTDRKFNCPPIRISAQEYLQKFYESFQFKVISEPYDEDGILHIDMLRQ